MTVILVTFTKNKREMTITYVTTIQDNKPTKHLEHNFSRNNAG